MCVCVCVCVCVNAQLLSHVQLFATPWTVACQTPLSVVFSRQEYWRGLLFPPPGNLPNPGIKPVSPAAPALAGGFFTTEPPGKPIIFTTISLIHGTVLFRVRQYIFLHIFSLYIFFIFSVPTNSRTGGHAPLDLILIFLKDQNVDSIQKN